MMVTKYSHRTPSRAMTLAEMEIGPKSAVKQEDTTIVCRPTNKAKRLVDLLGPSASWAQSQNSGQHQSERKYSTFKIPKSCSKNFTTSKIQNKPHRHENPTVRRTINFMSAPQVDGNQKMSSTNSRKTHFIKDQGFSTQSNEKAKPNASAQLPTQQKLSLNIASVESEKRQSHISFEMLERQIDTELQLEAQHQKGDARETLFTQYRDVNNSFDVSSYEQSPTINIGDGHTSFNDCNKDTPNKSTQLSDSICELMDKAELTSNYPDISKQLLEIRDQLQENVNTARRQKAMIVLELKKNKKCIESINELLKVVSDNNTRVTKIKKPQFLPSKQHRSSVVVPVKRLSLRSRLSVTNTQTSPLKTIKKNESPINTLKVINTAKTKSPRAKKLDLRKMALLNTLDNSNIENITPSKEKKSFQMYTSLKNSLNFLKTPNSKKNVNQFFETPNSKSRHATSSNIKEQLERLYDE